MTATNKFSVTRALATIKNLDAKIERAIPRLLVATCTVGTGNNLTLVGTKATEAEFTADVIAAEKALTDMIDQRARIKAAVIKSNAATKVMIGTKEMTVAEAIESKKSVGYKVQMLANLRKQLVAVNTEFNRLNDAFQTKLDVAESQVTGRDKKSSKEEVDIATAGIKLRQTPAMLDPLGLSKYIDKLDAEVQDFLLNVDFALSEVNAKTDIEV
ncbi:hypothetical protein key_070 [Erwinia phage KEY]|uniref:Tail fiber protein n=1 Tax=Erwinia phage KEY TaxID=2821255 RepID=A0AAE7WAZ7_9CAUD|nr:hypothetical protein key_070 [Erwinia phage KEY]